LRNAALVPETDSFRQVEKFVRILESELQRLPALD
jgi:hypothetical protein